MFLAPPETAHNLGKWFFKRRSLWKLASRRFSTHDTRLRTRVGKLELPNPVGLAAGFDKNCEMLESLFRVGFGYVTLGTVTLNPRDGNAKPRIWRVAREGLVNSMGLPNKGARAVAVTLSSRHPVDGPVILSVSGLNEQEFVECYRLMEPLADGVELNISTPNTVGVRIFQDSDKLASLLDAVVACKASDKPIWVKLPPHFDGEGREKVHRLIDVCMKSNVQALTCSNTKLVNEPRASIGTGGLSGPPLFEDMLRIVCDTYQYTGGKIAINACGGITSGLDAWKALQAGASTVQIYTALVYHGPGVVSKINRELLHLMQEARLGSTGEVRRTSELKPNQGITRNP
jgi:dihydroorotate dehydrogenase